MMTVEKVISVSCSRYPSECITMQYKKGDILATAALAEKLSVKEGDLVWVLNNDKLDYKGYNSVAVLHV